MKTALADHGKLIRLGAGKRSEPVPSDKIIRCKALSNYTWIYIEKQPRILVSHTLGYFEEKLLNAGFIRIHRGEIINKQFITSFNRQGELYLADGSVLNISRRRKRTVFEAIS